MGQHGLNDRQQRWVSKVHAYDFDIEYVRGNHNVVADALSRRYARLLLMSICHDWKAQLLVEYSKDNRACDILGGSYINECYKVMDEVIFYKGAIFFVLGSQLRERFLRTTHDCPLSEHRGFRKTYMAERERFTWKVLKGDVLRHVQEC